jgi:mannan endo-1,4-beta-mannosidase
MKLFFLYFCFLIFFAACSSDSNGDSTTLDKSDTNSSLPSDGATDGDTMNNDTNNNDTNNDTNNETNNNDNTDDTASFTDNNDNYPGYKVEGRHLFDRCGEKVILRGVNKMVVWTDIGGDSFPEIAKTGANSVRIVWLSDRSPQQLDAVIARAIDNGLIPMIELHDATGEWDKLSELVDYWVREDVVEVVVKYEKYLLVNIGNEVGDGSILETQFLEGYKEAITRMRTAGYKTPLVIDGLNWGQDIAVLQSQGPALLEHDPASNLLFSVHMWWPSAWHSSGTGWATVEERVTGEIARSVDMNLPLIIGEFAHVGPGCIEAIPYKLIIEEADKNEIGWLAWSWGPGNNDCEEMDMTTDSNYDTLGGWGLEVAVTDTYSIANTSVRPNSLVNGECE